MEILIDKQLLDLTARSVDQELFDYVQSNKTNYTKDFKEYCNFYDDETLEEYVESRKWGYFNNFHTNLPEGFVRSIILPSRLDMINRQILIDINSRLLNHEDDLLVDYSELYLDQTPRQFFETIDQVLGMYIISIDQVNELREKSDFATLYTLTLPTYVHLRALGYNHHELTM